MRNEIEQTLFPLITPTQNPEINEQSSEILEWQRRAREEFPRDLA